MTKGIAAPLVARIGTKVTYHYLSIQPADLDETFDIHFSQQ